MQTRKAFGKETKTTIRVQQRQKWIATTSCQISCPQILPPKWVCLLCATSVHNNKVGWERSSPHRWFFKVFELCLCNDTPSGVQSGADIGDFELLELLLGKNSSSGGISRAADSGDFLTASTVSQ